jgi:hypothetical protein
MRIHRHLGPTRTHRHPEAKSLRLVTANDRHEFGTRRSIDGEAQVENPTPRRREGPHSGGITAPADETIS